MKKKVMALVMVAAVASQQLRQLLRRQLRQLPLQQLRQLQKQQPRQLLRQLLRHNFLEYRKGLPGNREVFFVRKKGLTNPQGMNKLVTVKKIS